MTQSRSAARIVGIALLAAALVTGAAVVQNDRDATGVDSTPLGERVADVVPLAP